MKNSILIIILFVFTVRCTNPEPRKPVVQKTSTFLKESIVRNKAINKIEEAAFLELMQKDSIHNYISSESGFWYFYNLQNTNDTIKPQKGDEVIYRYEIRDIYGDILYTEDELKERSYLVDKQELITGLQDGLKLMKEGEEVTFLFPSHKAYGYAGYQKIGSNQPLIYKVKIEKIIFNN